MARKRRDEDDDEGEKVTVTDPRKRQKIIRDAARAILKLKAEQRALGAQMAEHRGKVKSLGIKAAIFNAGLKIFALDDEDERGADCDATSEVFKAFGLGVQLRMDVDQKTNGHAAEADPDAEGFKAGKEGMSAMSNPYKPRSKNRKLWADAWLRGTKENAPDNDDAGEDRAAA